MKLKFPLLCLTLFLSSSTVRAAETEYTLEPIYVKASSSFDSLGEDQFIPQKKINFDRSRGESLKAIEKTEPYPTTNQGYPSGAIGSTLGGRSVDDVQVSTLGVPLNLPQGGGPDLSLFPAFLWSGLSISTVPSLAGFSPQGVSGSMQFDLWTRTQVRELKNSTSISRVTGGADRQLQNFSIANKNKNAAILAGMNLGLQKGPAGSLSYYFIRKARSHYLMHFLGSDQEGVSPGDKNNPSPNARKKAWRIIPALESHQEFGDEENPVIWESTFYADLHQLIYEDPGQYSTSTRTQQYGVENAVRWNGNTFAFTARLVDFQSSSFGKFREWPVLGQYSREFKLSPEWNMRFSGGGNYVSDVGFAPTTRVSFQHLVSDSSKWFFELNSLAKMPTLASRYYVLGAYHGNPNLKVERVNSAIAGFTNEGSTLTSTTTFKSEYRSQIQVNQNNTTENAGNATLLSLKEDLSWKPVAHWQHDLGLLFAYSRLSNSKLPYPDLPYFSMIWSGTYIFNDQFKAMRTFRYVGSSTRAGGGIHDHYFLMDLGLEYSPTKDIHVTFGCDNVTNQRAEVVADYPLPGAVLYAHFTTQF